MPYAISTDGARIHFEVTGRRGRPAVLLVQGLGAEKNSWNIQRAALALNWKTVALDNRGVGRSDKPTGAYSLEQMADDAIAVLDAANVESAHIVGLSMGGAISQIIALKYPQRVRSLTLIATACRNQPWREELLASWSTTVEEKGVAHFTKDAARWLIGPRSFRRLLPAFGVLGPLGIMSGADGFTSQVEALVNSDNTLYTELENIACPTMVIVGNQDILTPRSDAEEIAKLIPTAELVIISGAAHGVHVEHALTVNKLLLDFLGRSEKVFTPHGHAVGAL